LEESDKESYEFSKLKKFLTIVKFMMQDSILKLSQLSLRSFNSEILQHKPDYVKCIDSKTVENKFHR